MVPFRPKLIRTISGVFGSNWQVEFDFRRRGIFFERFEFLVCSKSDHMQRDYTCACDVASLYPHNSISNVVVSSTIR